MISYYCIVNLPGVQVRDIVVVSAASDLTAELELKRLSAQWPGFETIALYEGERAVSVLSNPALGFPTGPLHIRDEAA
ncbi:MAG: hypothetical protein ACK4FB_01615 [Brevundimonas sp.]|uniref:hypothetical protein n=1 Tax=Brevundimonas sp. TaxID=1871086 RepID=UPI00391C72A2